MTLSRFYGTAWERHRIFVLKELGLPKPWTSDPIFSEWYFCNVFRRLDKTSRWIEQNVIKATVGQTDSWKWIMLARYISKIATLERLDMGNNLLASYRTLRSMQMHDEKIFTNAFIVNSKIPGGWTDKVTYIFMLLKQIDTKYADYDLLLQARPHNMERIYRTLYGLPGVGEFMAYQYTVDFTYSERYIARPMDAIAWTILGLGAIRGLNRLLGNMANRNKIEDALGLAVEIWSAWSGEIAHRLSQEIEHTHTLVVRRWQHAPDPPPSRERVAALYSPFEGITLMDVEHWLCEYDKYMRGGSRKRRYHGGNV